jgi:NitT/TauT family transport system ATP-binding protein
MQAQNVIQLDAIEKWYGVQGSAVHALSSTDLAIAEGEFVVLLGPSGCGKTTLLRMIGGLVQPTAGSLLIKGHALWSEGGKPVPLAVDRGQHRPAAGVEGNGPRRAQEKGG